MKPLGDVVLIKLDENAGSKKGNIFIPETVRDCSPEGIVIAIGTGKNIPPELKVGDRVLVQRKTGRDYTIDSNDFSVRLFPIELILGIKE